MEQTECSETLAYKIQTLENYPEESIQHKARNFRWARYAECMVKKKPLLLVDYTRTSNQRCSK
jgi:hypothetical protein